MSKIEQLIAELCPEGVNYKPISDCIITLKTGLNPRKNFKLNEDGASCAYITGKDIFNNRINVSERTDRIFPKDVQTINKRAELEKGCLLFASTGTGTVGRMAIINEYDGNWAVSETLYCIKVNTSIILAKYLMYLLYSNYCTAQYNPKISKGSVPHLKIRDLLNVIIPTPPLEIQQEIARILDNFTNLKAELQAELQARKEQYEYYRSKLLSYNNFSTFSSLDDLVSFTNGKGHEKVIQENGKYIVVNSKFISTDGVVKKYSDLQISPLFIDNILMVMSDLPNGKALAKCFIVDKNDFYTLNQRIGAFRIKDTNKINVRFLYYMLNRNHQLIKYDNGVDQTNLKKGDILNISIPVPPLVEQQRIVSILDNFEALVNDSTNGLPAEIEALQQQYEYYRDKLLTFNRKA